MLKGKDMLLLGVTGSIAAYKIAELASRACQNYTADVHVIDDYKMQQIS